MAIQPLNLSNKIFSSLGTLCMKKCMTSLSRLSTRILSRMRDDLKEHERESIALYLKRLNVSQSSSNLNFQSLLKK